MLSLGKSLSVKCSITPLKGVLNDDDHISAISFIAAVSQSSSPSFDFNLSELSPRKIGGKTEGFHPIILYSRLGSEDLSDILSVEEYDLEPELIPEPESEQVVEPTIEAELEILEENDRI